MSRVALSDRFLSWHSWVLLGYALMGRGFSYVGVPPLFIGEITLVFGFVTLLVNRSTHRFLTQSLPKLLRLAPTLWLVAFMTWCLVAAAIPQFPIYGMDTVRDSAIWYYGFYALIIATILVSKPDRIGFVLNRYRQFTLIFLFLAPIGLYISMSGLSPLMPGGRAFVVEMKPADTMVHLAGVAAFVVEMNLQGILSLLLLLLVNLGVIVPMSNRSGLVAFLAAFSAVAFVRLQSSRIWYLITFVLIGVGVLVILNPETFVPLVNKMMTIISNEGSERYQGTKEWRINWWNKIIAYTFGGEYFWTGRGFGINLATVDGFDPFGTGTLRSPHNGHFCILARSGVPGFLLWVGLQVSWAWSILVRLLRAYTTPGQGLWRGSFLLVFAYWLGLMVTISLEVILEGPTGGIWYWSMIGFGLALIYLYDTYPDLLTYQRDAELSKPESVPTSALKEPS
jgi:O-Antigen ligase